MVSECLCRECECARTRREHYGFLKVTTKAKFSYISAKNLETKKKK